MKLDDGHAMKFGKHKGLKLSDVPSDYLLWLGDEMLPPPDGHRFVGSLSGFRHALLVYIAENRECLEKEAAGEL
ncbi:hypothetical protein BMS3Bbin02_00106 [bacterium BMS3Bbin02]|nr:hypothetical protein BMS3Bbin02_00106 [bacterium BMS3Bbin02]